MKSKMNIKSIVMIAAVGIISLFFINMSFAANIGKVSVETANLRETADESAKILELLSMNEEVEVVEKTGDWYKVKAKGITGYLRQDLITINGEVAESENNTISNNETANTTIEKKESIQTLQTPQTEEKDTQLGKQKVVEDTRLKIVPVINATDVIEVKKDEEVSVVEVINGWACVETETAKGWIRKEKLQEIGATVEQIKQDEEATQEQPQQQTQTVIKTLFVNSTTVNLRKEPSTSSEIVASLPVNMAVDVVAEENGWSQVKVSGKEGYISSSLLSATKQETSRSTTTSRKATTNTNETITADKAEQKQTEAATPTPVSGNGAAVVAYAKQFIGIPYTYGGSSPSTGFDCSGFTSYVYKNFGVNLPRTSGGQSSVGTAVSKSDLAPGDLVIYSGHVAIYVGGGQVIHAPRPGKSVCIVPLSQAAGTYLGARRVI